MKRLFYAACGLLFLGACAGLNQSNNVNAVAGGEYDENGNFVAYCSAEPAPVIFTKEGFPIIDDQACIPEPEVLGITVTNDGPNPGGGRPFPDCDDDEKQVGYHCVSRPPTCDVGEQLRGKTCEPIVCPTGEVLNGNTCEPITCPPGEELDGNTCVPTPEAICEASGLWEWIGASGQCREIDNQGVLECSVIGEGDWTEDGNSGNCKPAGFGGGQ